ncbi:hypothetical protein ABPG72_002938 [Tetrahymena utriculariae]
MKFSTFYRVSTLILLYFEITAQNFQIDLNSDDAGLDFLIIEINIVSTLYSVNSFVACLNFSQNAPDLESYYNSGFYACQFSDIQATQEQLTQHLLIINTHDPIYSTRTTIFYHAIMAANRYSNSRIGKCSCQPQIYGADCSVQLNILNLGETQNVSISNQQSFFPIKFGEIVTNSNGNSTQICLQKFNSTSLIYFQVIFNKLELSSKYNNNISQTIHGDEIAKIQIIDNTCLEYQRDKTIKNQTQLSNCFAVISIQQSIKDESTLLSISVQNIKQVIEKQNSSSELSQKNQENTKVKIIAITLSVFGGLLLFIFIFLLFRMKKRRASNQNSNNQHLQKQLNQIFQNDQININVTKAKILFLQEALMPIILFETLNKQKELNVNYLRQDNQGALTTIQVQSQNEQNFTDENFVMKSKIKCHKQKYKNKNSLNQNVNSKCLNKKDDALAEATNNCSICLVEFGAQDELRLTICRHLFHSECLIAWINKNESCPLCRQSFTIADILEYSITTKINQNATTEQQIKNQKDKILETLLNEKHKNLSISDLELLNIFKYFLPFQTLQRYQLIQNQPNQNNNTDNNKQNILRNTINLIFHIMENQSPINTASGMAFNLQFKGMLESINSPQNHTRRASING